MNEKRLVIACFGLVMAVVVGLLAVRFIEALTISVFLYYSTRRYYKALRRLRLTAWIRAVITMASLVVPLFLLISHTVVILVVEARQLSLCWCTTCSSTGTAFASGSCATTTTLSSASISRRLTGNSRRCCSATC